MTTDPQRIKRSDPGDPELSPVFQLHKIFSTKDEQDEVAEGCRKAEIGCLDCKAVLIRNLFKVLEPLWEKRDSLMKRPDILKDIISSGSGKAREVASVTIRDAVEAVKLNYLK